MGNYIPKENETASQRDSCNPMLTTVKNLCISLLLSEISKIYHNEMLLPETQCYYF